MLQQEPQSSALLRAGLLIAASFTWTANLCLSGRAPARTSESSRNIVYGTEFFSEKKLVFHLFVNSFDHAVGKRNVYLRDEFLDGNVWLEKKFIHSSSVFRTVVAEKLNRLVEEIVFFTNFFQVLQCVGGTPLQGSLPAKNRSGKVVLDKMNTTRRLSRVRIIVVSI